LPLTGKNSVEGHREAFRQMQDRLRDVTNKFRNRNWGNKVPSDVNEWLEAEAPYPAPKSPPEAFREALGDAVRALGEAIRPPTQDELDRIRATVMTGAIVVGGVGYLVCCS
jgi:preprotein translocase subunit Sss1